MLESTCQVSSYKIDRTAICDVTMCYLFVGEIAFNDLWLAINGYVGAIWKIFQKKKLSDSCCIISVPSAASSSISVTFVSLNPPLLSVALTQLSARRASRPRRPLRESGRWKADCARRLCRLVLLFVADRVGGREKHSAAVQRA